MEKDDTPHTMHTWLTWFAKEIKDFLMDDNSCSCTCPNMRRRCKKWHNFNSSLIIGECHIGKNIPICERDGLGILCDGSW
jgi:hypothetical protein